MLALPSLTSSMAKTDVSPKLLEQHVLDLECASLGIVRTKILRQQVLSLFLVPVSR